MECIVQLNRPLLYTVSVRNFNFILNEKDIFKLKVKIYKVNCGVKCCMVMYLYPKQAL